MNQLALDQTITATIVPDEDRLKFLPKYSGRYMLSGEAMVYSFLTKFSDAYSGGFWDFYELSNGGFYMAPQGHETIAMCNPMNYFSDQMSNHAAGITVCLFSLSCLSLSCKEVDREGLIDQYYLLRDYALHHDEGGLILSAID